LFENFDINSIKMSLNLDFLVKYYDYNYSITLNNNSNSIRFAVIYEKIRQRIGTNISFETHLFEVIIRSVI
jgi:hypothetical protein